MLLQVFGGVQTQALDAGSSQIHVVLPLGLQASILRRLGVDKLLAVRRVELSGEGALVGLRHAGAIQSVGPLEGKRPVFESLDKTVDPQRFLLPAACEG